MSEESALSDEVDEILGSLTPEQRGSLGREVEGANEKLFQAGAAGAEQSFGLGCMVFALPVAALDLILLIFGVFNLIIALIVLFMGGLLILGVVTLMAFNARARRVGDAYHQVVEPEIAHFLAENHLSRRQFNRLAATNLPENAPLRSFLQE